MDGDEEQLSPAERERERRRDRDATAQEREGMRTGLAKQFKQVLDTQRRRAEEADAKLEQARDERAQRAERSRRAKKGA